MSLSFLQEKVDDWVKATFGDNVQSPKERALRLAEEVVEFAQAVRVDPAQLHKLIDYVYSRPMVRQSRHIWRLRHSFGGQCLYHTLSFCIDSASEDSHRNQYLHTLHTCMIPL